MSTENQQVEQPEVTKEQVVAHLTEQIEVMKLRVELQKLNTEYSVARAEEIKAVSFVAQMMQPPTQDESLTDKEPAEAAKKLQRK